MARIDERVSVHTLDGDELAAFIADHVARWGFPPIAGADGSSDAGSGDAGSESAAGDEGGESGASGNEGANGNEGGGGDAVDFKAMSRKHEREKKAALKRVEQLEAEAAERENATKTDHEKAIEQARKEAREAALSEAEKDRRADRLELAVTRSAAKTFADVDDALTFLQADIAAGRVDDDIFDTEGKVQTDALEKALKDLLERKPHLAAGEERRFKGGTGAGNGSGAGRDPDDISPEEHFERIQRGK